MSDTSRIRVLAAWLCAAVVVALASGCSASAEHPAVATVEELLELRRDDIRDAEAYTPYFLESELATALAEGSEDPTGTPRVPEWDRVYLSEETSSTASVVVVWKADKEFEDWPTAHVFSMQLEDDRWVVVDAVEATSAPEPLSKERK